MSEIKKKKGQYKVGKFVNWEMDQTTIVTSFKEKKIRIKGKLAVATLKEDFNYEDEIQIQVYGKQAEIVNRAKNNGQWERSELFLKPYQAKMLISCLQEALEEIKK